MVACGSLLGRCIAESLKENHVVPDVGIVGARVGRVEDAGVGGESSGSNTRGTVEGVDFKTGVIGEDEFTGSELRIVNGLNSGVRGEGFAILFRRFDLCQTGKRFKGNRMGFCRSAKVTELSLAGGGDVQAEAHERSVTGEIGREIGAFALKE